MAYTFSRTLDTSSGTFQDIFKTRADYGRSGIHRAHILNVNWVYEIPFFTKARNQLVFCLSIYQSGAPNSVTVPTDVAGIGSASSRADGVGIPSLDRGQRTLSRWFNTEAFLPDTRMVAGQFGNSGRNILIGPSYTQHDVALMKNFTVTERVGLQFRAESFNVLNNWPLQASTRRSDLITRADRHKITERLLLHSPAGLLASD